MKSINRLILVATSILIAIASKQAIASSGKSVSFEINPQGLIYGIIPGSKAFSGAGEVIIGDDFSVFAEASQTKVRLKNSGNKTDLGPERGFSSKVTEYDNKEIVLGLRAYGSASKDSWFAEVYTGTEYEIIALAKEDSRVSGSLIKGHNGVGVGYRWIWNAGFLVRLTAGFDSSRIRSLEISHNGAGLDNSEQMIDEMTEYGEVGHKTVKNKYEMGIGWTF